ncbi:MAG: response regulator [Haloarculaceae archaeon]
MDGSEDATVLVVDDERHLADLYAEYLEEYETLTAYGGAEALDRLSPAIDVVVLDRRMPDQSGNEVLAAIGERDLGCRVALVTGTSPDFDVIGLGVDDYLVKPVTRDELRETVDRLCLLDAYTRSVRDLTTKKVQRNVLAVEKPRSELEDSDWFQSLQKDIDDLEATVERIAEELDLENESLRL